MIVSINDLKEIANNRSLSKEEIRVCMGTSCLSLGAAELQKNLQNEVECRSLTNSCSIKNVGCNGLCANGTLVSHYNNKTNESTLYEKISSEDAKEFIDMIENPSSLEDKKCDMSQPFFTKQKKIVLENIGIIDPDDIEDYIAHGGYFSLFKALYELSPKDVIEVL